MALTSLLLLLLGLVILLRGANDLVEGASGLALRWGVAPLLVGLTVVAFGTSAPELVTGIIGAIRALGGETGAASVVVGTMLGSNTCNVGLILGMTALVAPVGVASMLRRRDVPLLLVVTSMLAAFAWTTGLGRLAGVVLFATFTAFTLLILRSELRGRHAEHGEDAAIDKAAKEVVHHSAMRSAFEVAAGLALLVLGAWMLVEGAVRLARQAGISEAVIGLTIVAIGTSLPELATSMAAARKGQAEIALGNVVGSNAFNLGAGIGLPALITPLHVESSLLHRDVLVMLAFTVALAVATRQSVIGRRTGIGLLLAYGAYLAWCAASA